jgi:hypothetical protein
MRLFLKGGLIKMEEFYLLKHLLKRRVISIEGYPFNLSYPIKSS